MRHSPEFYVNCTFADILYNLRMEYNHLKLKEGHITAVMVAEAFKGNWTLGRPLN